MDDVYKHLDQKSLNI